MLITMQRFKEKSIKEVKGGDNDNAELIPKEFMWDILIAFVVFLILFLAAADFLTEFVRGSGIVCLPVNGTSFTTEISHFCSANAPSGVYFSFFIVLHGLILLTPHYLWLYHFENSFHTFFKGVSRLQRNRECDRGEYAVTNTETVEQLEKTFTTGEIFHSYIFKLVFQLVWAIGGFSFVLIFFHQKFGPFFYCYIEWINETKLTCVYDILHFLELLWVAELALLFVAALTLFWAILWCFDTHQTELGSLPIAVFCYHYGLSSKYYAPKINISSRCDSILRYLFFIAPLLQRIMYGGPHIVSSLDFMVMKLYHSKCGLGHIFKQSQITSNYNRLCADDRRRLQIHVKKHGNIFADDHEDQGVIYRTKDIITENKELMWQFTKQYQKLGIYSDFKMLSYDYPVVLPGTIRGTVLGFSSRAPNNGGAIEITFGLPSFSSSLARVFRRVTALCFNSNCKNKNFKRVLTSQHVYPHTDILTFPEDIFSLQNNTKNEFLQDVKTIWMKAGSDDFIHTAFIVVGPIAGCGEVKMTSVDHLLETVAGQLHNDAVLLTVRPLQIFNRDVADIFSSYQPPKSRFEPLEQTYDVINRVQEWVARNSSSLQSSHWQSQARKQSFFRLRVVSGDTPCTIEFTTYRYVHNPDQPVTEMCVPQLPFRGSPRFPRYKSESTMLTVTREEFKRETKI